MITRLSEVRGVGCLKHLRTEKAGEYAFSQGTVLLAPDASGETTLAAVLKSYGPIRLMRIPIDSPDLLAVIQKEGKV